MLSSRWSRQRFLSGFLGVILIAALALAAVPAALAAGGESGPPSTNNVRKQAQLSKQQRASKFQRNQKHRGKPRKRHRKHAPKAQGPVQLAPGVTESPNGWIHYTPVPAGPSVRLEETNRYHGTPAPGGGCTIVTPSPMPEKGRELIREEVAYNPDTCESVYLERLIGEAPDLNEGIGLKPGGAETRVVPGDAGTVQYASGHNMQLWVDPLGITITGLSVDLRWPLDGAAGEWALDPYAYKFRLDGWRAGRIQRDLLNVNKEMEYEDERMWGTARPNAPSGGNRATVYRRFENIDFYKAVKAAKFSWVCYNVDTTWTIFEHEVQVVGYHNGRMGTWQHSTKSGPCEDLVHRREKVAWGIKGDNFPKEFRDETANKVWRATHAGRVLASLASADRLVLNTGTSPVPWDLLPIAVNPTSVQLEGAVNPRGKSTNWWVQCGPTEAYGMWTSGQVNIGSGTTAVPVTVTVPNLQANTTYHCRIVALNMQGEASFGPDEEFSTSTYAPATDTAYTDNITDTSATMLGWLNPNGAATNFYFQWGKTTAYGNDAPAAPGWSAGSGIDPFLAGYELRGLEVGTTYHYRLIASNAYGTSYGDDQTFTTAGAPPSVTTGPAEEVTMDDASLTGAVNPNGLATNYYFEFGRTTNYENRWPRWAPPGSDAGSGTSIVPIKSKITIGNLDIGVTYHYRLVATNVAGTTYGEDRTFTMLTFPPVAITKPATEVNETSATLRGIIGPNKPTTAYFQFGKTTAYGSSYPLVPESVGETSTRPFFYTVYNLSPGTTYHYRAVATSYSGTSYGADETFTTTSPLTPRVEATNAGEVTQSKITMASKVDVRGLAGTYYFEYGNSEIYGSKTEAKAVPSGTGFQQVSAPLEGLPNGATVYYRVVVTNSDRTVRGPDQVETTGWTNEQSTGPKNSKSDKLMDVSCPSAGNCIAVGSFEGFTSGNTAITASRWNGTSWSPIEPPIPAGNLSELKGVSCVSMTNCIAVGHAVNGPSSARPLVMKWNGTAWTELSAGSGLPAGQNLLYDVDCPAANSCEAVGYNYPTGGPAKALAMHYDGSVWTVRASANPVWPGSESNPQDVVLFGVSCASTTVCKAVGSGPSIINGVRTSRPVIERLSGSEWVGEAVEISPNALSTGVQLGGVSCPTTTTCFAVGGVIDRSPYPGPEAPFIEYWDGSKWSLKWGSGSLGTRMNLGLADVSCSSPTSCRASGGQRGMQWTGSEWRLQTPKLPSGVDFARPGVESIGISCPTASECHSVGSYIVKTTEAKARLTQGWSGSSVVPKTLGDAATSVSETGAAIRAFVDPAGVDTKHYFEWGPTASYGSKTAEVASGSGGMGFNSGAWIPVAAGLSNLTPGVNYHYRVVATNGISTAYGPDTTFETPNKMNGLVVAEPFDGGTNPVSDFATKWAPLQWTGAGHKGNNNANGYGPVDTAANGAYFMPPIAHGSYGVGTKATLEAAPGVGGRIALWLDMASPTTAKSGYQLVFQETSADVYTVTLKKWLNGVETSLGSKTGYAFPVGSAMALADRSGTVSAWGKVGGNFVQILSAYDITFSAGNTGIEVTGSSTARLFNFGAGTLSPKFPSFDAAVLLHPPIDTLDRTESPLSLSGGWAPLSWATATVKAGKTVAGSGWSSGETASSVAGAYWQKAQVGDTGTGDAVIATTTKAIGPSPNYLALWLNAPSPGTTKSGYQLRLTELSANNVNMLISKWVNGVLTPLAGKSMTMPNGGAGTKFALVDRGGTVSLWSCPSGGTYSQVLVRSDSTYSYGYAGVEGVGSGALRDFKLGTLYPF